jgi:hypothetical protein|tara:strand:- start:66 stop:203 length:138 start_codon:yes stop_codon:yes gene_type:complete
MTLTEQFQVEQTIEMIEVKLEHDSNSCEYEFYLELKDELQNLLRG